MSKLDDPNTLIKDKISVKTSRPTVFLQDGQIKLKVPFNKCLLSLLGFAKMVHCSCDNEGNVVLSLTETFLENDVMLPILHPSSCPLHCLSTDQLDSLCNTDRPMSVSVTNFITSADGFVLITRRAKHLNLFPGVWVLPGGHVENGETFLEAGLRELYEETGIQMKDSEFVAKKLFLFESCFPPFKECGLPKRRHLIIVYHIATNLDLSVLESKVNLLEDETDSCVWLHQSFLDRVAKVTDNSTNVSRQVHITKGEISYSKFDTTILSNVASTNVSNTERLSTSTRMAFNVYSKLRKCIK